MLECRFYHIAETILSGLLPENHEESRLRLKSTLTCIYDLFKVLLNKKVNSYADKVIFIEKIRK